MFYDKTILNAGGVGSFGKAASRPSLSAFDRRRRSSCFPATRGSNGRWPRSSKVISHQPHWH